MPNWNHGSVVLGSKAALVRCSERKIVCLPASRSGHCKPKRSPSSTPAVIARRSDSPAPSLPARRRENSCADGAPRGPKDWDFFRSSRNPVSSKEGSEAIRHGCRIASTDETAEFSPFPTSRRNGLFLNDFPGRPWVKTGAMPCSYPINVNWNTADRSRTNTSKRNPEFPPNLAIRALTHFTSTFIERSRRYSTR